MMVNNSFILVLSISPSFSLLGGALLIILIVGIGLWLLRKAKSGMNRQSFDRWRHITQYQAKRKFFTIIAYLLFIIAGIAAIALFVPQREKLYNLLKWINISYISSKAGTDTDVLTTNTTLYTTLMTVLLSLIALAVTAFVFLNDALSKRERYEQNVIYSFKATARRRLFLYCFLAGLGVAACLTADNVLFSGGRVGFQRIIRYGAIIISTIDILLLIWFINTIVNYEKNMVSFAISYIRFNQKDLTKNDDVKNLVESTNTGKNSSGNQVQTSTTPAIKGQQKKELREKKKRLIKNEHGVIELIKRIGDLENLVTSILQHHESEYRYQRSINGNIMLSEIVTPKYQKWAEGKKTQKTSRNIPETLEKCYCRLIEVRNCLWILQQHNSDEIGIANLYYPDLVTSVWNKLMQFAYKDERFVDLNFSDIDFSEADFTNSSMEKSALVKTKFNGAILKECDFSNCLLQNVDFTDAYCEGAVFKNARVIKPTLRPTEKTSFCNAVFRECEFVSFDTKAQYLGAGKYNFKHVSCDHANFVKSYLHAINFTDAVFTEALLADAKLSSCTFIRTDFGKAKMANTEVYYDCKFDSANCSEIAGINSKWGINGSTDLLGWLDLSNSRFQHANLASSTLSFCKFINAYMNDITLVNAEIKSCNFYRAILINADFSGAKINDCSFIKSILRNALFIGQNNDSVNLRFDKADLSNSSIKNQTFIGCNFDKAIFDGSVIRDTTFKNCKFKRTRFVDVLLFDVKWEGCTSDFDEDAYAGICFGTPDDREQWETFLNNKGRQNEHT